VKPRTFFVTLTACRIPSLRSRGALAATYGQDVLRMLDSDLFHALVMFFTVLANRAHRISLVKIGRATRTSGRQRHVSLRRQRAPPAIAVRTPA